MKGAGYRSLTNDATMLTGITVDFSPEICEQPSLYPTILIKGKNGGLLLAVLIIANKGGFFIGANNGFCSNATVTLDCSRQ